MKRRDTVVNCALIPGRILKESLKEKVERRMDINRLQEEWGGVNDLT